MSDAQTIEKLLRQQVALARFGSFSFAEPDLQKVLVEAARACADSLNVPFAKICRHRKTENDLVVEAGYGWRAGVIGSVVSAANQKSTQGRAFVTGKPVIVEDLAHNGSYAMPAFYAAHDIVATADVLIKGKDEAWGVLEVDSPVARRFDEHDIEFLTGFANVVAEAVGTAGRINVLTATVKHMESLVAEKDVLAEELQHRVRNNLQLLFGMLTRQMDMSENGAKDGLRSIASRVMSLAAIYDHLLGNGLSRTIGFDGYVRSLCDSLRDFQGARPFPVTLTFDSKVKSLPLDLDSVTALGIVIAETVSNAYIHAFRDRGGFIRISLASNDTSAILTISDDGIGFVEPPLSKRHGLGLVRRLMEQIEGTARVVSDHGTKWTFTFPMAVTEARPVRNAA